MANSEIDIMQQSQYCEVVSMQVVTFHCGMCGHDYEVDLLEGDVKMVACPECENANLQSVVGTA
jgi:predicted nucleic acid-binding Zn ribbon protein